MMRNGQKPGIRNRWGLLRFDPSQTFWFRVERTAIRSFRILIGALISWIANSILDDSRSTLVRPFAELSPLEVLQGLMGGAIGIAILFLALYTAFGYGKSKYEAEREWRQEVELEEYLQLIHDRIHQNWTPPASAQVGLKCTLDVIQNPSSGEVNDVYIRACNGDDEAVRSIESAVRRSSPLPKPPMSAWSKRNLELYFNPTITCNPDS